MEKKIDEELAIINVIVEKLYQNNFIEIAELLDSHFKSINEILLCFLKSCDVYKQLGIDIPKDVLINQIKNFMNAYEKKDCLMLADVLKYEISESMLFYKEIIIKVGN